MVATNTTITLPNPYTPMAFVPPELETRVMGQKYSAVGSLAVGLVFFEINLCVDCMRPRFSYGTHLHLPQDYRLATQYRINISFIIYCISRCGRFYPILRVQGLIETSE